MDGKPDPDPVERSVDGVDAACQVLDRHVPDLLERLRIWRDQTREFFDTGLDDTIDLAVNAITVCVGRIVLRNGSASPLHRYFHDEQHPFDLMQRLRRLFRCAPTSLAQRDYIALALFAAGHDLRQDLPGLEADGVGRNERASALELERIMLAAGFNSRNHSDLLLVLRPMIDGTTFRTRPFTHGGREYGGGVLAPALVATADQDPNLSGLSERQRNLVLLATDIDTGNVADPFAWFMNRACRLCREGFAVNGMPRLDTDTAAGVYSFVTGDQERYFFRLQRFHSPETRACFQADKDANGERLLRLTAQLRERYESELAQPGSPVTGEEILQQVLELSARETPQGDDT